MSKADRIVALVKIMRKNSEDQEMHLNLPLAEKAMKLLEALDDPEEGPLGKAYACNAILEQLPEYDVPRFVLGILRRELAWLEESTEKSDWLHPEDVKNEISKFEDYINPDAISMQEFCKKYNRHLLFDPVERTPLWEEIYYDVEVECFRHLKGAPRGMGFCFGYWAEKRAALAKRGIDWQSPHMMNPRVMFD